MRSHDTLSTSKDDHERDERRDFPAHSVHGGHGAPAISRLVEHAAVPMPPQEAPVRTMAIPIQTMFDRRGSEAAMAHKLDTGNTAETDDEDEESEETPRNSQHAAVPAKSQASPAPHPEQHHDALSAEEEGLLQISQEQQPIYDVSTLPLAADSPNIRPAEFLSHTEMASTEPVEAKLQQHQFEAPLTVESNDEVPQTPTVPRVQAVPPPQPLPSFNRQYNTAPPTPPPPAATGSQPPTPPVFPPIPPRPAYPNPGNPNQPPSMNMPPINGVNSQNQPPANANTYNNPPQLPNYNVVPVPPASRRGVDMLARIGVVGNFLGNRKTRRTLSKKIELGQQKAAAGFAELQTQHQAIKAEQARQAQELQKVRTSAERFAPASNKTETLPPIAANPNARPAARPEAVAAVPAAGEQQQQIDPNQPIELQAKQHFERSAWHSIVVDEKGREVKGAMSYGEEFKQQRKETIRDDVGMGLGTAAAAAPVVQDSSTAYYGQPVQQPTLSSGMTTPGLPQGMPTHIDPQHQLPTKTKKSDVIPGPVFWVMLVVILAAFFAAASF